MKEFLAKEIFYLKVSEWLMFATIISIYTGLTIWLTIAKPFTIDSGVQTNYLSIAMSWIAATFTILGTFLLARGKRIGFILDAIAFIALAVNLVFLANDKMVMLGLFYFLVPIPITFLAYFFWKKRKEKGIEKVASKNLIWNTALFAVVGTGASFGIILGVVGIPTLIDHGLKNIWEIPRMFFEILKIFLMICATLFFVMGVNEAWTFVMALEATNIVLYSITFSCSPNPDEGYFLNIFLYSFEFIVASYGAFLWYFKKVKNN